jgi:hypothetical protein
MQYSCPTCNAIVLPKKIAQANYKTDCAPIPDGSTSIWVENNVLVSLCPGCSGLFLVHAQQIRDSDDEQLHEVVERVLYPTSGGVDIGILPESVARAYLQAKSAYASACYDACVIMVRKTLECVCKHHDAGGDLSDAIQVLRRKGVIDDVLERWFYVIRKLGNKAVHEPDAAITREKAADFMKFTEAIVEYVFWFVPKHAKYATEVKQSELHTSKKTLPKCNDPSA